MKNIHTLLILVLLGLGTTSTGNATELNSLNDYISHALANSSQLKAAYYDYLAAKNRTAQVASLPDPKLNYAYFIDSVETRVGPQQHKIGIAQSFPWFGTLDLRGTVANLEAQAELYRFLSMKNSIVYEISKAYTELAYVDAALIVTKESIELVHSWENVLQERFRTGSGSHSDLIKVQVELGKLEDRLAGLKDLKEPLNIHLNSILNRQQPKSNEIYARFLSDSHKLDPKLHKHSLTFEHAKQNNPELLMLRTVIKAKDSGIALAEKKFYPDLTVGLDYIVTGDRNVDGGGDDALLGMVTFNLPLYRSKNTAALAEATAKKNSFRQQLTAKELEIKSHLAKTTYELRDSQRKISLYKDTLISKAQESIEASYTAYQAGEANFLDVIDSEERLLEFRLLLKRSEANRIIAISRINMLAGGFSNLPAVESELSK